jgi:hypothetical protein
METERLLECDEVRFGFYTEKPKHTVNDLWRNDIHIAWDNLIQG